MEKINILNNISNNEENMLVQLAKAIKEEFPPDGLTLEIVLTRPEEVYQFGEKLPKNVRKLYRNIVENKINEMSEME